MTNHHLNIKFVCQLLLELVFPVPHTITIATAGITQNQDFGLIRELGAVFPLEPPDNRRYRKGGGIMRCPNIDTTLIVNQIINPIGYCFGNRIRGKFLAYPKA